jgi:hypothetical protein
VDWRRRPIHRHGGLRHRSRSEFIYKARYEVGDQEAALALWQATKRAGVSSSVSSSLSNCLAGPEVDQMNSAAVKTTHRTERIWIVAGRLLNKEALHA